MKAVRIIQFDLVKLVRNGLVLFIITVGLVPIIIVATFLANHFLIAKKENKSASSCPSSVPSRHSNKNIVKFN